MEYFDVADRSVKPHELLTICCYSSKVRQRRQWQPTPVLLPGKSHGQRSLVGCSPCGCCELDTTERLHFHFSLSCIGEGNGSPLQCSCLENPRHRGDWWAAIYEVAQSETTEVTQQQQQQGERNEETEKVDEDQISTSCSVLRNSDCVPNQMGRF